MDNMFIKTVGQALRVSGVDVEVPQPPITIWRYLPLGLQEKLDRFEERNKGEGVITNIMQECESFEEFVDRVGETAFMYREEWDEYVESTR